MSRTATLSARLGPRTVGLTTAIAVIALIEFLIRVGVINRFILPLPSQILVALPRIIAEENVLHRFAQTMQELFWASLLLAVTGIAFGALLYRFQLLRAACETWVGALAAAPIVLMYPLFLVIFGRSATTIVMIGFAAGLAPVILKTLEGLTRTRQVLIDVGGASAHAGAGVPQDFCRRAAVDFRRSRLGLIFAMINIVGVEF
jgi:ABC-type nitrate/sulfonate/bicarbonate transport system permease component